MCFVCGDSDEDGRISRLEWLEFFQMVSGGPLEAAERLFDFYDSDRSGFLEEAEVLPRLGSQATAYETVTRTVSSLKAPYPTEQVRIVNTRGGYGGGFEYTDGIVRKAWAGDDGSDVWGVTVYQPIYRKEVIVYPKGSDVVTEPTRTDFSDASYNKRREWERSLWTSAS
ncbi:hypothetical protein BG452_13515 [Streptomyces sp. CBMA123]|nr:hypothetical protein [Streptomyces sp. CBMA123]